MPPTQLPIAYIASYKRPKGAVQPNFNGYLRSSQFFHTFSASGCSGSGYAGLGGKGSGERRQPGEFVRRGDQGTAVRRLQSAVAAVGSDDKVGFGPRPVERPSAFHGADDVVTALHNYTGN